MSSNAFLGILLFFISDSFIRLRYDSVKLLFIFKEYVVTSTISLVFTISCFWNSFKAIWTILFDFCLLCSLICLKVRPAKMSFLNTENMFNCSFVSIARHKTELLFISTYFLVLYYLFLGSI